MSPEGHQQKLSPRAFLVCFPRERTRVVRVPATRGASPLPSTPGLFFRCPARYQQGLARPVRRRKGPAPAAKGGREGGPQLPAGRSGLTLLKSAAGEAGESLGDAWADTTTPHGRLMLTVLGGLAEFERELILARTSDGRDRAKAKGVKFGRKPSLTGHQRDEALGRLANGEAQADVARSYNVSQATISRLAAA